MQASLSFRSSNSWGYGPRSENDTRLPDPAHSEWPTISPTDLMVEVTTSRASSLVRDTGTSGNFHLSPAVGGIDVSGGYGSPQSLGSYSPGQDPYELSPSHGIYDMSGLAPPWNFGQGLGLYDPNHIVNVPTNGLPINSHLQHHQLTDWAGRALWQPDTQPSLPECPPTHLTIGAERGGLKAKKKPRGSRGTRHQTTSRRQHTKSSPMSMYALQEATIAHNARNEVHESSITNKPSRSSEICICKWCHRALSGSRNLVRHVRTACKKSPFVKKKMPYECHLCEYGTARLDNFKRHNCSRRRRKSVTK